jgi:hypothetical protein
VSSLVEAKTLADDYALTHKLIFLKNKKAVYSNFFPLRTF